MVESGGSEEEQREPMSGGMQAAVLAYSVACVVGAACILLQIGAAVFFDASAPSGATVRPASLTMDAVWVVLTLGGGMGAVHSLASIGHRAGALTLYRGWEAFYFARPFTGAGMALVTMLALRGGIGGFRVDGTNALLAWSALAGLYSQPALDKLKEVFATIFALNKGKDGEPGANELTVKQKPDAPKLGAGS